MRTACEEFENAVELWKELAQVRRLTQRDFELMVVIPYEAAVQELKEQARRLRRRRKQSKRVATKGA